MKQQLDKRLIVMNLVAQSIYLSRFQRFGEPPSENNPALALPKTHNIIVSQ